MTVTSAENLTLCQVDVEVRALADDRPIWEPLYLKETLGRLHELMEQRRRLRAQRSLLDNRARNRTPA